MNRECSTHEIHKLAQESAAELEIRLKEQVEACKLVRAREIQQEVDSQNRLWFRRLFKWFVTPETVQVHSFFDLDLTLHPTYLMRHQLEEDLKMVIKIMEASVPGTHVDRVILTGQEYRTLLRYSTYAETRKNRQQNSDH